MRTTKTAIICQDSSAVIVGFNEQWTIKSILGKRFYTARPFAEAVCILRFK